MEALKYLALTVLVFSVLSATVTAQNGNPIENLQLSLGETRSFNIHLKNPLTMNDDIMLSFSGRAFQEGYVTLDVSSESDIRQVTTLNDCNTGEDCCDGDLNCVIRMSPGEEKDIEYTATATLAGQIDQAELLVDAKSDVTQLTGSDRMTISTRPVDQGEPVSAPALTYPYILVLAVTSSIFYLIYKS
mgnify:CR=1 FL=1